MDRLVLTRDLNRISNRPIIGVHGFGYDPSVSGDDDPFETLFPAWQEQVLNRPLEGFGYYSVPVGVEHVIRSWLNGRWNRYRYAWDRAEEAGKQLRKQLFKAGKEVDIICHSLGSRVVASAFTGFELPPVNRVLIFNGAEHSYRWDALVADLYDKGCVTEFMNICVDTDDVLHKMGALFSPGRIYEPCVGYRGLEKKHAYWVDVQLNGRARVWGRDHGMDLRGDNPRDYGDHWYSYRYLPNWELYRPWLNGNLLLVKE